MKSLKETPVVSILPEALNKIRKYADLCDSSIYWIGKVVHDRMDYTITDAVILPQTVGNKGCIDYDLLPEIEFAIEEEGFECCCLGRTKKDKPATIEQDDIEMCSLLCGDVGTMIYIQLNKAHELDMNLIDFDSGILYDDLQLHVSDTEFYSDEEILNEISEAIEDTMYVNKHQKTTEIQDTDKKVSDKEDEESPFFKDTKQTNIFDLTKEPVKSLEPPKPKVYTPNEFVEENTDFADLTLETKEG